MRARPVMLGLLVVGAGLIGVSELADATLTTHESTPPGSRSDVVIHAETVREGEFDLLNGVDGLVRVCQLEVGEMLPSDAIRPAEGEPVTVFDGNVDSSGRFAFSFEPALDDADQKQFSGCIEDIVVDHLQASVESLTYVSPADNS